MLLLYVSALTAVGQVQKNVCMVRIQINRTFLYGSAV